MIAIVGAGISGLALAHELSSRGVEHVVLEEQDRAGGVIRSACVQGRVLDWGPQRTRLVGAMRTLIESVGLLDDIILAAPDLPLLVLRDNHLREVPRSFGALLRTDLIGATGKVRLLAEPLTSGAHPSETVANYFIRKVGYELYANMIGPLYGGLYASDPADMIVELSLVHALREMGVKRSLLMRALSRAGGVAIPVACSFRDGMQMLPDALYRKHAANVRLGCGALDISAVDDGYVVQTSAGEIRARDVVMTGSASATASLMRSIAPTAATAIATLRYNPLAIVHLQTDSVVPRALGYQVGFDEELYTRGVTFNDAMFDRDGVYTAYLGGARNPDVVSWEDSKIADIAITEFFDATGAYARPLSVARAAMPAWDRSWRAITNLRVPRGIHFCTNWETRPGLPGRLARAKTLAASLA